MPVVRTDGRLVGRCTVKLCKVIQIVCKKYLSRYSVLTLVKAFYKSRIDYCKLKLTVCFPKEKIAKLPRVQKAATRLLMVFGSILTSF